MAAQSQTTVKALGLNINPNFLDLPNGSLVLANDVIIKRENVIESRRGLSDWSEGLGITTDRTSQLIQYKDRILANYSDKLAFDAGVLDANNKEIMDDFAGSYTSASQYRMRSIEANKNLYFTTSNGIKKISAATADDFTTAAGFIQDAGAVKAIDFTTDLEMVQGQSGGFLPIDSTVAYRTVWGYKDLNQNLTLGSPSTRNVVYNFASDAFVMDFNKLLTILDIFGAAEAATPGTTLISDINYYSTYALGLNASGNSIKGNLMGLATKIDADILLGDTTTAPLVISTIEMNGAGVITLTFSSGIASNYISFGDYVNLQGLTTTAITIFNNNYQVTSVLANAITFQYADFVAGTTLPVAPTAVDATTTLNSYNYTQITHSGNGNTFFFSLNDTIISAPITSGEIATAIDTLNRILIRLGVELPAVIAAALITNYITPFNMTESGNVRLQISIPTDSQGNQLGSNYFLQVYRSNVFEAFNGSQSDTLFISGNGLVPNDELHLIFEYFPTATDFANGFVVFTDSYPDSLAQTNTPLYTNPVTGDGILQSNDIPPYATDINSFKNVTFYSNTKTRHLIANLQLIGVDNIVSGDKITIANANTSSTYTFINGVAEVTKFTPTTVTAINSTFFFINSDNDINRYYVWFNVDQTGVDPLGISTITAISTGATPTITTTNPHGLKTGDIVTLAGTDSTPVVDGTQVATVTGANTFTIAPANPVTIVGTTGTVVLQGILGIEVSILSSDTVAQAIERASETLNDIIFSFTSTFTGTDFTVTNIDAGLTTDAVNSNVPGFTVLVTTQGTGEDAATGTVQISRTLSAAQNIDLTARSLIRVINQSATSPIYSYYTSGDNTSPGQIALESKVLANVPFYVIASSTQFNSGTFGIGTSFTPDISPIHIVTGTTIINGPPGFVTFDTLTPHGLQNGYQVIITNTDTTPVTDGVFTVSNVTANTFDVFATLLTIPGTHFSWELTSDSVTSTNSVKPNRVYYSKFGQPDAVPILNYFDIGPEDKDILRIFPLRTTLFVFKEDGLYRISGEVAPFTVQLFDSSCVLIAPDTIDVADNTIFGWTTKGITNITESGTNEISKPVDVDILKLASYPNFKTLTWGVGYNSDYSYTTFTNAMPTDTEATIGYRYSTLTNTWTNVIRSQTCGLVRTSEDKLYMGNGIDNNINKERKNFDRTDYADKDFTFLIDPGAVNSTGSTIQFASVIDLDVGDVLFQDQYLTIYKFNNLLLKLDSDPTVGDNDYFAILEASIGDDMRSKILALSLKLDSDPGLTFTTYNAHIIDYTLSIASNNINNPTVVTATGVTNLVDGRIITISGTQGPPASIPVITGQYQVSNTGTWGVSTTFTIPVNVTTGGTTGLSLTTDSSNILDIQACFNALINLLNNDPGATYANYMSITFDTPFEAVIIAINRITKRVTLNIGIQWVVGNVQVYKAIPCTVIYSPLTFGDVLKLKQVFESTVMFSNTAFTSATISFSSDLKPDFISVFFNNLGNGIFGSYSNPGFGFGYFGGGGNAKPFRTLIPLQTQRCRFINLKFHHQVAREICELYGVTLTANIAESTRAYR